MEPQPVVVGPPGGADGVGLLQDDGPDAALAQGGGDGEPAGAAADDVHRVSGGLLGVVTMTAERNDVYTQWVSTGADFGCESVTRARPLREEPALR